MPLSSPSARQLLHTRRITAEGYQRTDGLYDLEAHLVDTKTFDRETPAKTRAAGQSIHDMRLRITIDAGMHIVGAEAAFDEVPYEQACETVAPDYGKLVGLRIAPGFNSQVRNLLGGRQGCTHMTDLIGVLATLAFQAVANQKAREQQATKRPFQFDRCHGLRTDGPVVARYYPRWAVAPEAEKK
jgi:hypothetical protein